jgi:hypothetical protein
MFRKYPASGPRSRARFVALALLSTVIAACGGGPGRTAVSSTSPLIPCATPRTASPPPGSVTVKHVPVALPNPKATIDLSDLPLTPIGNDFILRAKGIGGVDPRSGKGFEGPFDEYEVSDAGSVIANRKDWQVESSTLDATVFTLAGPNARWSWIDGAGKGHNLALDASYLRLLRDMAGHLWAIQYGFNRDSLFEFVADGSAATAVDYGGTHIYLAAPGCDGAMWIVTRSGALMHVTAREAAQVAHLPFDSTVDSLGVVPASDGSVWMAVYRQTGEFTRQLQITRYGTSGAIGNPIKFPQGIALSPAIGPDGALWGLGIGQLYRIGFDDILHMYPISSQDQQLSSALASLAPGADGSLWYACAGREICSIATR